MSLSVVQTCISASTGATASFGSGVTAGNTVLLGATAFAFSNTTITSSNPTLGGSVYTGAVQLEQTTATPIQVYQSWWMLPVISGSFIGAQSLTFVTNNNILCVYGLEVSGLGSSPAGDQTAQSWGEQASGIADSGSTGAITAAPEIVLGLAGTFATHMTAPTGGGWTVLTGPGPSSFAGYQIATSSGGTYDWQNTTAAFFQWAAGVATVKGAAAPPPSGHGALIAGFPS